jgi:hypothetical protein
MSQLFSEYYASIRRVRAELSENFPSGDCLIISVRAANNGPCETPVSDAARWIVEGNSRIATPEEANKFRAQRDAARARSAPDSLERTRALFDAAVATKGPTRA